MKKPINLIILNGPSSAGKSTLAKALQTELEPIHLHFEMDAFWNMLPLKYQDNDIFPFFKHGIAEAINGFLKYNHSLIVDSVFFNNVMSEIDHLIKDKTHVKKIAVLVLASKETLTQREKNRGDRKIGLSLSQYDDIQKYDHYDLIVKTDDKATDEIIAQIKTKLT